MNDWNILFDISINNSWTIHFLWKWNVISLRNIELNSKLWTAYISFLACAVIYDMFGLVLIIYCFQATKLSYLRYCDTAKPVKCHGTWKTPQICNKIDLKYGFIATSSRNISTVGHVEWIIVILELQFQIFQLQIFLTTFLTQGTPVFNCQQVSHVTAHVQNADEKK